MFFPSEEEIKEAMEQLSDAELAEVERFLSDVRKARAVKGHGKAKGKTAIGGAIKCTCGGAAIGGTHTDYCDLEGKQ